MTDLLPLLKETVAYRTVEEDKAANKLSHAYLLITADKANVKEYLKLFAKLVVGADKRSEKLIDDGIHPDVHVFPKSGDSVLKEDVSALIAESFLKPVEGDKKIFLLSGGESMNASSQNKLLKTLEEPPSGVHIFIGATSEYPILPTVRSRMKKLVIPPFPAEKLIAALSGECIDPVRLKEAVAAGDGTVGRALKIYGDENFSETLSAAIGTLCDMRSSREIPEYSEKIMRLKDGTAEFLSVLELLNRDLTAYYNGAARAVFDEKTFARLKAAKGYCAGVAVYIADKIAAAQKRLSSNGNPQAVTEWLLFAILEGKHKWQKL